MKAYVVTTGCLFGLLTLAHIWRMIAEEGGLATNPWYVATTAGAAAMAVWAWRAARSASRS
jgi:hypothetical protein